MSLPEPQSLRALASEAELLSKVAKQHGLPLESGRAWLLGLAESLGEAATAAGKQPPTLGKGASAASASITHLRVQVCTDGAARGNPGPSGAGAVLQNAQGEVILRVGRYLGHNTNNVAEYEAMILGLKAAKEIGAREVRLVSDSELLVRQLQGRYQVKAPHLKKLYEQVKLLSRAFEHFEVSHVLRAKNKAADEVANRAVDERLSGELEWA